MVNPPKHAPHEDYYHSEEDLLLSEVVDTLIVKYGGSLELLTELFRELLTKDLVKKFDEFIDLQSQPGNWDYDPYMHGMANGMIFMKSLVTGEDPRYLETPSFWLVDKRIEKQGLCSVLESTLTRPTRFVKRLATISQRYL